MNNTAEIEIDRQYGIYLKDKSWVPSPRYLLRRARLLKIFDALKPGAVLEVGCGAGGTTFELARLGFRCDAMETSEQARNTASRLLAGVEPPVRLHMTAKEWGEAFDYLVSCEVLEHIEHDEQALNEWVGWLKPGGSLVLTVPAHMSQWAPSDIWAGHFRRYEQDELLSLLQRCGLECQLFGSVGCRLAIATNYVRNRAVAKEAGQLEKGNQQATDRSGVDRTREARLFGLQTSWPGRALMAFFSRLQVPFSRFGLGDGFIVVAKKPE